MTFNDESDALPVGERLRIVSGNLQRTLLSHRIATREENHLVNASLLS
jgi:hypothetical protein